MPGFTFSLSLIIFSVLMPIILCICHPKSSWLSGRSNPIVSVIIRCFLVSIKSFWSSNFNEKVLFLLRIIYFSSNLQRIYHIQISGTKHFSEISYRIINTSQQRFDCWVNSYSRWDNYIVPQNMHLKIWPDL